MDFIREYWWLLVVVAALVIALILLRPKQRVTLSNEGAPLRPHMPQGRPLEGRGIAGEAAAATSDVAGDIFRAPVHRALEGGVQAGDDLCRLKGVGPKFADSLHSLGFHRFEQLAGLSPTEIDRLDGQLGAFRGRITRDRIADQADYLARNDVDGFEQRFGKL